MEKVIEYSNEEVTVVWKPEVCIHSAKCVGSLPGVFKPKDKPWIQLEHANTDEIINAVKGCPSGALTHYMSGDKKPNDENSSEETKVAVVDNGPLLVHGSISIEHTDGSRESKSRVTAFCRCSKSENQPYCDGSHKK